MIGIGLDSVEVARFREVLSRRPRLAARVFTQSERDDCAVRADPVPGLAARFAAKEATMKALGVGLGAFALNEVEVVKSSSGAPSLRTTGQAAALAKRAGIVELHVSLTHTAIVASAVVVAS